MLLVPNNEVLTTCFSCVIYSIHVTLYFVKLPPRGINPTSAISVHNYGLFPNVKCVCEASLLLFFIGDEEVGCRIRIRLTGPSPLHVTRHPLLLLVSWKKERGCYSSVNLLLPDSHDPASWSAIGRLSWSSNLALLLVGENLSVQICHLMPPRHWRRRRGRWRHWKNMGEAASGAKKMQSKFAPDQ